MFHVFCAEEQTLWSLIRDEWIHRTFAVAMRNISNVFRVAYHNSITVKHDVEKVFSTFVALDFKANILFTVGIEYLSFLEQFT